MDLVLLVKAGVLGIVIVLINGAAAKEVWEVAEEERLAAKALAGEEID